MSSFLDGHGFVAESDDVTCDTCGYVWDGNAQCTMCDPDSPTLFDDLSSEEPAAVHSDQDAEPAPEPRPEPRPKPRFYDQLTGALCAFKPTKETRYTAQLNMYRHILTKKYKLRVRDLMLVRLDPTSAEHQVLHVPMMPAEAALLAGPSDALPTGSDARDGRLSFDEASHTYTIAGVGPVTQSVTAAVAKCFPKFDPDRAIASMRAGSKWGPGHRHWGQSDGETKRAWEEKGKTAADAGTKLHDRIDAYYKDRLAASSAHSPKRQKTAHNGYAAAAAAIHPGFAAFDEDMQRRGWRIMRTEWRVFSSQHLAGSIDAVYASVLHPTEVAVVDWKVTEKAFQAENFGKL